jgi:hypothetical protein
MCLESLWLQVWSGRKGDGLLVLRRRGMLLGGRDLGFCVVGVYVSY